MQRIGHGYRALIEAAYEMVPAGMHRLIRPHFLCGVDPVFVGLHCYEDASFGRSYRSTAHVAYEFHQPGMARAHRRTTVVLPERPEALWVRTVVHELGHVLDASLGFVHMAVPVGAYAGTNRYEAFAEAFAAWALPAGHGYGLLKDRLYGTDRATVALFDDLAGEVSGAGLPD
jgi:hypothetical protein